MQQYKVENGIIYSKSGMPYGVRWFCDDRLAFQVTDEGIEEINFWGMNTPGGAGYIAFRKRFWSGMQLYQHTESGRKLLKPEACEIWPYGYRSWMETNELTMFAANNCIYMVVRSLKGKKLTLEFYDEFRFFPGNSDHCDVRYKGAERTWDPFTFENNCLRTAYHCQGKREKMAISANLPLTYTRTPRFPKNVLAVDLKERQTLVLCVSFSDDEPLDWTGYAEALTAQQARYAEVARKAPKLKSNQMGPTKRNRRLEEFFQLAPMYAESLKIKDAWGMIRARTTRYWAWGWDTMTSNNCLAYWGDEEFLGNMLASLKAHAHPEKGIAHSYGFDMRMTEAAPPPAQGMYLTVMDLYRQTGGDISAHYEFAKKLFHVILETEKENTGLCVGLSLYPDFRELIRETGNDLSAFNNTVAYCAARSMARIAEAMGDAPTAAKAAAFADRILANFQKVLYNRELDFIDSSVEADTLQHRNLGSNNAIKWESNDCADLVAGLEEKCLTFYEKNLVCEAGLRPVPEWDDSYDTDGNQMHCWWPVMSEFYTRLANRSDRSDLLNQYADWVAYWTERMTCPEGISCYCNDQNVPFDNWNSLCGVWHGYSIRGFYNAIVHSYVGVDIDHKGLHLHPRTCGSIGLNGLHFGSRSFDIFVTSGGRQIKTVMLNGENLGPVTTIPFEKLQQHNNIYVEKV